MLTCSIGWNLKERKKFQSIYLFIYFNFEKHVIWKTLKVNKNKELKTKYGNKYVFWKRYFISLLENIRND